MRDACRLAIWLRVLVNNKLQRDMITRDSVPAQCHYRCAAVPQALFRRVTQPHNASVVNNLLLSCTVFHHGGDVIQRLPPLLFIFIRMLICFLVQDRIGWV
jgi:hypothetical protein